MIGAWKTPSVSMRHKYKTVNEQMHAYGLKVIEVDLKEILNGGGGPHCMSFPLERAYFYAIYVFMLYCIILHKRE